MTEKLYYTDAFCRRFRADVLACEPEGERWAVELDRTAFFPEGGGQGGDRGAIGDAAVLDTRERGESIVHLCDRPLAVGMQVEGALDWDTRFARMQIHSAEHIVSGTAHREWGCENVGFHMTERLATLDFDRELDEEQLRRLERLANETAWADLPILALYPTAEELGRLVFRQKKELSGQIRLIEIPGVDLCACCAPHVDRTGRIGLIRLTDMMRHRGGVRITMSAGRAAYAEVAALSRSGEALSRLFSAPREGVVAAAEQVLARQEAQKLAMAALERRYTALRAQTAVGRGGNICVFEPAGLSAPAARALAEALAGQCRGVAGVFAGSDGEGWRYVLASGAEDLRARVRDFNAALGGRGGGAAEMVQGSVSAAAREIEEYFYGKKGG